MYKKILLLMVVLTVNELTAGTVGSKISKMEQKADDWLNGVPSSELPKNWRVAQLKLDRPGRWYSRQELGLAMGKLRGISGREAYMGTLRRLGFSDARANAILDHIINDQSVLTREEIEDMEEALKTIHPDDKEDFAAHIRELKEDLSG